MCVRMYVRYLLADPKGAGLNQSIVDPLRATRYKLAQIGTIDFDAAVSDLAPLADDASHRCAPFFLYIYDAEIFLQLTAFLPLALP